MRYLLTVLLVICLFAFIIDNTNSLKLAKSGNLSKTNLESSKVTSTRRMKAPQVTSQKLQVRYKLG